MNAFVSMGTAIAVAGVGAAKATTTEILKAPDRGTTKFAIEIQAAGASPRVSVKVLASFDGVNYVIPDDMASAVITIVDTNQHIKTISPTVAKFYKLQLDGDADNGADTVVNVLRVMSTQD